MEESTLNQILELGRQGVPVYRIADEVGVYDKLVARLLDEYAIPRERHRSGYQWHPSHDDLVRTLAPTLYQEDIAVILGCGEAHISRTFRRLGLPTRHQQNARVVRTLLEQGLSRREIEEATGLSCSGVAYQCRRIASTTSEPPAPSPTCNR